MLTTGEMFLVGGSDELTEPQKNVCETVRILVEWYFGLVKEQVQDHVPKSLLHSLVYHTVDKLNVALMSTLCPKADWLINEADKIAYRRQEIKKELEGLTEASKILEEVRHNNLL